MKEFRFPLAPPFRSKSFWNERADNANNPPVRPQFSLGRHDPIPFRREMDEGFGPTHDGGVPTLDIAAALPQAPPGRTQ